MLTWLTSPHSLYLSQWGIVSPLPNSPSSATWITKGISSPLRKASDHFEAGQRKQIHRIIDFPQDLPTCDQNCFSTKNFHAGFSNKLEEKYIVLFCKLYYINFKFLFLFWIKIWLIFILGKMYLKCSITFACANLMIFLGLTFQLFFRIFSYIII